ANSTILVRLTASGSASISMTNPCPIHIQVVDEGPGVSEELQYRIFNRYETGDRVVGTSQIGLGLTFCKMVAEAHGGQISVTDNHPRGSVSLVQL
ncbi:MAG: sensor histidine kinase, partial [Calothrix sp. SM1_7_51]|nr:sensor histidine kinase [Calothrix sp. SM1_7_51]